MIKNNESFTCTTCQKTILPANRTCRNHCPHCFTSMHVDDTMPGDRASSCKAIMKPQEYTYKNGQIKIFFTCTKCVHTHRNKAASDDNILLLIDLLSSKSNKTSS